MKNPNGFGTVTKLSGKRRKPWVVKVTVGYDEKTGRQIQKSIGTFETRPEAINHLSLYNVMKENKDVANLANPEYAHLIKNKAKVKHTLREISEIIIEKDKSKRSDSWYNNKKTACNLLEDIMDEYIEDLDLFKIQTVFDKIRNAGKSKSTLAKCKEVCVNAFEYAVIHKFIERNDDYSGYIDASSIAERSIIHVPFTKNEVKVLIADNDFISKVILVYIFTGCRASELLKNVKRYDGYIVCGIKTESGKNRSIPIHSAIEPFINDVLDFLSHTTYRQLSRKLKKLMHRTNMIHTLHDTRNTFATLGKECNMSPTAIKKIIGHKIGNITDDIYTHESIEYLKNEIEKIKIS